MPARQLRFRPRTIADTMIVAGATFRMHNQTTTLDAYASGTRLRALDDTPDHRLQRAKDASINV